MRSQVAGRLYTQWSASCHSSRAPLSFTRNSCRCKSHRRRSSISASFNLHPSYIRKAEQVLEPCSSLDIFIHSTRIIVSSCAHCEGSCLYIYVVFFKVVYITFVLIISFWVFGLLWGRNKSMVHLQFCKLNNAVTNGTGKKSDRNSICQSLKISFRRGRELDGIELWKSKLHWSWQ